MGYETLKSSIGLAPEPRQPLELETLAWVTCFNEDRMVEWLGNTPPAQAEANTYCGIEELVPEPT